jgi:hypothetical protein
VAVGFPKGIISAYDLSKIDGQDKSSADLIEWIILIALPVLVFFIMFARWRKVGRDPKGKGVIVPQYDVPENLTPFEVSCIVNQKNSQGDISAEIVYLATQGYLKIRHVDNKILGFIKV